MPQDLIFAILLILFQVFITLSLSRSVCNIDFHRYQLIERMTPVVDKYRKQLIDEGVIDDAWVVARETEYDALCDEKHKLGSQADRSKCLHRCLSLTYLALVRQINASTFYYYCLSCI